MYLLMTTVTTYTKGEGVRKLPKSCRRHLWMAPNLKQDEVLTERRIDVLKVCSLPFFSRRAYQTSNGRFRDRQCGSSQLRGGGYSSTPFSVCRSNGHHPCPTTDHPSCCRSCRDDSCFLIGARQYWYCPTHGARSHGDP